MKGDEMAGVSNRQDVMTSCLDNGICPDDLLTIRQKKIDTFFTIFKYSLDKLEAYRSWRRGCLEIYGVWIAFFGLVVSGIVSRYGLTGWQTLVGVCLLFYAGNLVSNIFPIDKDGYYRVLERLANRLFDELVDKQLSIDQWKMIDLICRRLIEYYRGDITRLDIANAYNSWNAEMARCPEIDLRNTLFFFWVREWILRFPRETD